MEYFDIVDEAGIPVGGTVSRKEAHEKGIRHRTAHIWVVDRSGEEIRVLLQRRSMQKESYPGCYDTSAAGHIAAGDEPLPSALREFSEELGIQAAAGDLTFIGTFPIDYEKEFHGVLFRDREVAHVYLYEKPVCAETLTLQKEELDSVRWFTLEETIDRCRRHDPAFCCPMGGLMTVKEHLMSHS